MKIFKVEFVGIYPVGTCLIIAAENKKNAKEIAKETLVHTDKFKVKEVSIETPCVIEFMSGDY